MTDTHTISFESELTDEEWDFGIDFIERSINFANFCYSQMGTNGVLIPKELFNAFFPNPETDFG